jgi:hypothetical protein
VCRGDPKAVDAIAALSAVNYFMPAKVTSDYSKFPAVIREVMPYVEGEVTELRNCWVIYHSLFMQDEQMTKFYGERFGPLLGVFQNLLGKEMILSIGRLTDQHTRDQQNLSVWSLKEAVRFPKSKDFPRKVDAAIKAVMNAADGPRKRRNKEIAHFDLEVSLGKAPLPEVLLSDIKSTLEHMEGFLNLLQWEFANAEVGYDSLSSGQIIAPAIETTIKAKVYDELEAEKLIPLYEWEKRMSQWAWWKYQE